MSRKNKKILLRLGLSLLLLVAGLVAGFLWEAGIFAYAKLFLCVAAWAVAGYDVVWNALRGILRGQLLDENFLMTIATVGALFLGEYPEAAAVMLLYQLGEVFQRYAVGKSRRSIAALTDLCPDIVNRIDGDEIIEVSPEEVAVGDILLVKPGERVPLDGIILTGRSTLNTSALTGESLPREVDVGDTVASGCVNLSGLLTLRVTRVYGESTVARILELTENAAEKKAPAENFITKFARIYTPVVVGCALLLCLIPTLLGGQFAQWFRCSLLLLMVSCPCALVISVPLGFFGGIGAAARRGILVKGSNFIEVLSQVDTVVFDKTGTLTQGRFIVKHVLPAENFSEIDLLRLAAAAEQNSTHPLAMGIVNHASIKSIGLPPVQEVTETAGHGVSALVEGRRVSVGGRRLLEEAGLPLPEEEGASIHILCDGVYAGTIRLADELKPGAADALDALKKMGIKKTVMLTGDSKTVARTIAEKAGVDEFYGSLLPENKVHRVEELLHKNGKVLFAGDGINDAPVLARADVGVAMGALGSDAAIEAADVVLMDDRLSGLSEGIRLARKTVTIVRQNIVFSLAVKLAVMICAAVLPGMSMTVAIFADVGVMMLAVLNSLRTLA